MVRIARRLLLTAAATTCLIALLAGTAAANRISGTAQQFDIRWERLEVVGPTGTLRCPLTLLGSFHSATMVKVQGLLLGYINHARIGNGTQCTNGRATVLQATLPWHIRYLSFTGTLPRIETLKFNLIRAAFRIQVGGAESVTCLATSTVAEPANGTILINESGTATSLNAEGSIDLNASPDSLCDFLSADGDFSGAGTIENLRGGTFSIRLI